MLRVLLLASLAVSAAAFDAKAVRPSTPEKCVGKNLKWVDLSAHYKGNAVAKAICIFNYETACPTLSGAKACDDYVEKCVAYPSDRNWNTTAGAQNWEISSGSYKQCVSEGVFWYPDTRVIAVAQIIATTGVLIFATAYILVNLWASLNWLGLLSLVLMLPVATILTVSYYYLNVIVVFCAAITALGLFSQRSAVIGVVGMLVCLAALFWVTFDSGLGAIQHHSRREAGVATTDAYESACNNYYQGYFFLADVERKIDHNPNVDFQGYCSREFLAAQLFLMILLELLVVVMVSAGSRGVGI